MGLDAVEIVIGWEEAFGISIADSEAMVLRTPRQSIDLIATKLAAQDGSRGACLTLRAFHRLRHSISKAAGVARTSVRPEARLRELVSTERRRTWEAVRSACGISSLPGLGWFSPRTVGDLTRWAVTHAAKELKQPGEPWTRSEIRSVVRAVVIDVTGVEDFGDDDDFIREIGVD
jgi:acyl carrier protein